MLKRADRVRVVNDQDRPHLNGVMGKVIKRTLNGYLVLLDKDVDDQAITLVFLDNEIEKMPKTNVLLYYKEVSDMR